jgi:putative transposase
MARTLRVTAPGLIRHVMSRGNARMAIFLDDVDYRQFIYELGEVVTEFQIRCWNYCVMPNHYHLTIEPTLSNISAAVARLNGTYAQWWNRRHGRVGHVFQGRFKDQIVDKETYLLTLSRYVVANPVRGSLVARPEDWLWSSYRATAGLTVAPSFLQVEDTLGLFGDPAGVATRARFIAFTRAEAAPALVDRIRSSDRVLGPPAFKTSIDTLVSNPGQWADSLDGSDPGLTQV